MSSCTLTFLVGGTLAPSWTREITGAIYASRSSGRVAVGDDALWRREGTPTPQKFTTSPTREGSESERNEVFRTPQPPIGGVGRRR